MKKFFLTLLMLIFCTTALADIQYTTSPGDKSLRSGPSEYADIKGKIVPDTQVSVVGVDRSTGYALVVTNDKLRGWLPLQDLTTTAPSKPVLIQPKRKPVVAKAKPATNPHSQYRSEPGPAPLEQPSNLDQKTYYDDVKEKLHALASANAANPNSLAKLTPQEMTNYVAIQRENRAWFISGAGILIVGMLIGLFISKITLRRRRSNWD